MELKKEINQEFVKNSYSHQNVVSAYKKAVKEIGLWNSEKKLIKRYVKNKNAIILDLGCGTGRATFGFYKLGYRKIIGLDLTPAMLTEARAFAEKKKYKISFIEGDARNLPFQDNFFDFAFYSFNGLMQIPEFKNRLKVLTEVRRVLKDFGYFIFCTHIRGLPASIFRKMWQYEEIAWRNGTPNGLHEYGDRLIMQEGVYSFLHFPDKAEVKDCIKQSQLKLVAGLWRSEISKEKQSVLKVSNENFFWITQK